MSMNKIMRQTGDYYDYEDLALLKQHSKFNNESSLIWIEDLWV